MRPLIDPHPSRRATARPADGAPEPGRVIGLAAVVVPRPVVPTEADQPAYFRDQPPLRHVIARPLVEHAPLTEATDAYVGEPVAATPAPAVLPPPSFFPQPGMPRAEPPVEATTDAGTRFREALANLSKSGLPEYVSPSDDAWTSESWRRPEPPVVVEAPKPGLSAPLPSQPPSLGGDQPRLMHRRTLAESRRLGLGAPLRRDAETDGGDGESRTEAPSDAEPARAQIAPPVPPAAAPAPQPTEPAAPVMVTPAPAAASALPPPPDPPTAATPPSAPAAPALVHPAPRSSPSGDDRHDDRHDDTNDDTGGEPTADRPRPTTPPPVTARAITGGAGRPTTATTPLVFRAGARRAASPTRDQITRAVERAVITRPPA
jgi:hypothetical protein